MEERRHTAQSKENDFLTVTSEYGLACAKEHGCLRGNEWIWGIIVNQESHENPCPEEHRDEGKSICWTERAVRKIRKSGYRQTKENNDGTASRMREWAEPLFPVSVISSQFALSSSAERSA